VFREEKVSLRVSSSKPACGNSILERQLFRLFGIVHLSLGDLCGTSLVENYLKLEVQPRLPSWRPWV